MMLIITKEGKNHRGNWTKMSTFCSQSYTNSDYNNLVRISLIATRLVILSDNTITSGGHPEASNNSRF